VVKFEIVAVFAVVVKTVCVQLKIMKNSLIHVFPFQCPLPAGKYEVAGYKLDVSKLKSATLILKSGSYKVATVFSKNDEVLQELWLYFSVINMI